MTVEELYTYIDSLNKAPGSYSKDELYKIGILHRQLDRSDRDWNKLVEYIGYNGKPESYRKFVARHSNMSKEMLNIIDDPTTFEEEYKEKTQIRDIYNAYRLMLRQDSRLDSFLENLVEAVRSLRSLPNWVDNCVKNIDTNGTEGILLVSDLHNGVKCDNFYNSYNKDIAYKRLQKLANDTLYYCKLHNVTQLNVLNLGDLIHGIIHINARIDQELNLIDQIITAAEYMANFLNMLDASDIKIIYRSCTDNHSRASSDKSINIEAENFSKLIDFYLKIRLEDSQITFINDNIDESLGRFKLRNGKTVMFAHGHLENINKCIDSFIGATKEFVDYVCLSHFHNGREKSYNGSKLIINGSIVGTEQFALSKRLFSPAEQKLLIFDRDNFLDLTINLQ